MSVERVGAKANVLHCVGFVCGNAALLILLKRWHFVSYFSVHFLSVVSSFRVAHNVRRYVQLAQSRGGACFCTRGAMQGYDVDLFVLALAKTVTPGGSPRRQPGRPAPPLKIFHFDHNFVAVQKPIAYTDLLPVVLFIICYYIDS